MSTDRPDEKNEGEDAFTVDEREMIDSDEATAPEISAEGIALPPPG